LRILVFAFYVVEVASLLGTTVSWKIVAFFFDIPNKIGSVANHDYKNLLVWMFLFALVLEYICQSIVLRWHAADKRDVKVRSGTEHR